MVLVTYTLTALLLVCLGPAVGAPLASKGGSENEVWVPETNEVGSPLQYGPVKNRASLKALVKALYRFDSLNKAERPSTEEAVEGEWTTTEAPDEDYSASSPAPPLVDDLSDLFYITAQMELDKSHKFTHSFRFGYGAPF